MTVSQRRAAEQTAGGRARVDELRRERRPRRGPGASRDPPLLAAIGPVGRHRRPRGAARRRVRHPVVLARLAAPGGRRAGGGGAASYGGGRRPRRGRHRRADPHPLDVRRTRDAPQGRDRELRRRRPLGRHQRRHQRARPRHPHRRAGDGVQRRALRRDRAQLGLLGRAGARPRQRRAARRHRPLHHLGPHPPDRPGDRARDGAAHRDRDAGLRAPPGPRPATPTRRWSRGST